jgi:integrase
VFGGITDPLHLTSALQGHLKLAGVDRAELFEHTDKRRRVNVHALRATFVTLALATGKSEAWVQDRTGHRSSLMVNRYRRVARTAAELRFGALTPLHQAIPEIRASRAKSPRHAA